MKKVIAGTFIGLATLVVVPNMANATVVHLCHFGVEIELPDWDTVAYNDHLSHGDTLNCEETTITVSPIEQETTTIPTPNTFAAPVPTTGAEETTTTSGDTSTTSGSVPDTSESSTSVESPSSSTRPLTVCESNPAFCEPPPISAPLGSTTTVNIRKGLPVTGSESDVALLFVASMCAIAGMGLLIVRRRPS